MNWSLIPLITALGLSPLLLSVINRCKAFFGGRCGQPVLQPYYDLIKLFRKGTVYSTTTSGLFKAVPPAGLAITILLLLMVPLGPVSAPLSFKGDLFALIYLLGLLRFLYVLAALDTGSAFEGMGASREMFLATFCEVALVLSLASLARITGVFSMNSIIQELGYMQPASKIQIIILCGVAMLIVLLAENARLPVDDPATHLELTMIHEVMILDYGGIDLGFIQYTSCLKLWIFSSLLVSTVLPVHSGKMVGDFLLSLGGMFVLAFLVGIIESIMARLRLIKIPLLISAAIVFAILALILPLR